MIVLGIDPGTASTGYVILESAGSRPRALEHGVPRTTGEASLASRLTPLHGPATDLLCAYRIDALYHVLFEVPAYAIADAFARTFDRVAIAGLPRAFAAAATSLGGLSRAWETGYLRRYGLTIVVGAALVLYLVIYTAHGAAAGAR